MEDVNEEEDYHGRGKDYEIFSTNIKGD